jgi:hypothetical protein
MVVANIGHTFWYRSWQNRKTVYTFETIYELINFMWEHIPMRDRDVDFIRNNDAKNQSGRLACTSWYEVKKSEDQMTEYTSF